jgi:hypothetical protein
MSKMCKPMNLNAMYYNCQLFLHINISFTFHVHTVLVCMLWWMCEGRD